MQIAAGDSITESTLTFRVLYVLVVLSHDRRRLLHVKVTDHPTFAWTRQQLREAFPWEDTPRFLLRDRDRVYGVDFGAAVRSMGIEDVVTAPRFPWQNPFVERVIGSMRRECLDHVIIWDERSLRHMLKQDLGLLPSRG
jgi:putative transposase